jgi:hypothetical protein
MSDLAPTLYHTLRELQNRDGEGEEREARRMKKEEGDMLRRR